jgi:hypothetical protein
VQSQSASLDIRIDYSSPAIQSLLQQLALLTDSNYVTLRKRDSITGSYILEAFAPFSADLQAPVLRPGEFEIPRAKWADCWHGHDPRTRPGVASYWAPDDHPEFIQRYSRAEQRFVLWVGNKSWFPLFFDSSSEMIVVLMRGKRSSPYEMDDVISAWIAAQEYVSSLMEGREHSGFVSALGALNTVRRAADREKMWQALAHCVTSQYGLGWNRVWFLTGDTETRKFVTHSCLGEINKERWIDTMNRLKPGFGSLENELKALLSANSPENDALSVACGNGKCEVDPILWTTLPSK